MRKLYLLALVFSFSAPAVDAQQLAPGQETAYVPGEVLIQLSAGHSIDEVVAAFPASVKMRAGKEVSDHMRFWQLLFDVNVISHEEVLKQLGRLRAVRMAQNNHYIQERSTVPNDTDFGSQWHHVNASDADIDSDLAWDITTGGVTAQGDTIVVALVEGNGAYYNHPDLIPNFWRNYQEIDGNGIDDDGNGYIDDVNGWRVNAANDNHAAGGHGTNCFGMIAARGNNSLGVVGASWKTKVMLVSDFGITEMGVMDAYNYPLTMRKKYNATNGAQGAFVVATSSSWGIDNANPALYPLWCAYYDTLGVHGILSPASTTNNTVNVDAVGDMPTGCSSNYMISVTRTGNTDNQAGGFGLTTVDLGAPGINVYTTSGTSGYSTTTGTSFSCPLTAGVIALMYSVPCASFMNMVKANPNAGAHYVRNALLNNVDLVSSMAGKSTTGGRLNSFKAVSAIFNDCSTLSCPQPFGIAYSGVTTTGANFTWIDGGASDGFYIYYRPVGDPDYDSIAVATNSGSLAGLLSPCTQYEVWVAADCTTELSNYSSSVIFTTDGCCNTPTGLAATVLTDSTASINFTTVTAAVSYNVRYKPVSSGTWTTISVTTVPHVLTGLTPCEDYEVQVQTVCSSITTAFSGSFNFHTTGCGNCEDLSYCATEGDDVSDEFIDLVQVGTINRISGADGGYIFTGMSTTLNKGENYNIVLSPGYSGTAYNEYFMAWIDYNQNGVFETPDERIYTSGGTVNNTVNGNFTVPLTATLGSTRMRVSMKYVGFGDTGLPSPCLMFDFGEVEDYCIIIDEEMGMPAHQAEVMCLIYPNPATSQLNINLYNYADFADGNNVLVLYNALGEAAITVQITGKNTVVDLSGISNGIYSYSLNLSGKAQRTGRVVVSK